MQERTLPNGDVIHMDALVDGSYWSETGEFDVTGRVIGWSPDEVNIAYQDGSLSCHPTQVRLAVGISQ